MNLDGKQAVAVTKGVASVPNLAKLLGCPVVRNASQSGAVVLAWGRKPSAAAAEDYAARKQLPMLRIEDGFLRSIGLGDTEAPLSIVLDDTGIYYDAASPSRLEQLISREHSESEQARARQLAGRWRAGRVSKYNHSREADVTALKPYVLVVDQTFGDASIAFGQANERSFNRMLEAALEENPDSQVVLKIHPDVLAERKRAHFAIGDLKNVRVFAETAHPVSLLEHCEKVYTVTSQMGFEGLLWGKVVRTFGMPFYAGWGMTIDDLAAPDRRRPVPLENLIHAALIEYPHYLDPETSERCEPERLVEWIGFQRGMRERFPAKIFACGFSPWKQPFVKEFFQGSSVQFVEKPNEAPAGATVAIWGRTLEGTARDCVNLEDGFLRSVGLGADLVRPLSWVLDRQGIYYDASRRSELERILSETTFSQPLLERARKLRDRIVENRITKYNLAGSSWKRPETAGTVILVPGQVESDASILHGTGEIKTNLHLLRKVRHLNPGAHLLYKPHPDVVAGLRLAGEGEDRAREFCNEVVAGGIEELIEAVDEVHVLTSLTGFEALLRGKNVSCYGMPFYAGWGLTTDLQAVARRTRTLSLEELIAGVLILYPTYVSRVTHRFTTPERALQELLEWRATSPAKPPIWRRLLRWLLRWRAN